MSFTSVRALFRDRLEGLGYEEHSQPFQPNQVGETVVDGSFHMETGLISGDAANQTTHSFLFPITIRIYKRGYTDLLECYDSIHETMDEVMSDLLSPDIRLGTDVKDIVPDTISIVPIDESNDNILMLELVFTARLELCYVT